MRQILSILMENEAGALSNMIGLFAQRALNIESLTVVPTIDSTLSQVTLNTKGDRRTIELIAKQINKLIDVLSVTVMSETSFATPALHEPMVQMLAVQTTVAEAKELRRTAV
ncbi:MAG: acetolactate synthase-1/3 small subunit [Alteromonadaceae bacterium]|jgi:acetolactate synthase-1/3 small subunit